MALTPHATLRTWLLIALGELDGRARKAEALDHMETLFGDSLTEEDRFHQPSRPESKWRNRTAFERARMIREGVLDGSSGRDMWTLSETGWTSYYKFAEADHATNPLLDFKPKDSSDYEARIRGRTLTKSRSHEALVADFGRYIATRGFTPRTDVHPRDILLHRLENEFLVEAKILYNGNATDAVRGAIGQLLTYQYFLYERRKPRLIALFSESIGLAYVDLLASLDIMAIWRVGEDWAGCKECSSVGLI